MTDFSPLLATESESESSEEADGEFGLLGSLFQHIKAASVLLSMTISVFVMFDREAEAGYVLNLH